jgi:hypothetical protein
VDWPAVFVVFLILHLVGDFALQTEWEAQHKRGGLGRDPVARRALAGHVLTYTLAFVPADPSRQPAAVVALDQTFHVVVLLGLALVAAA